MTWHRECLKICYGEDCLEKGSIGSIDRMKNKFLCLLIILTCSSVFIPANSFSQTSGETWNSLDDQSKSGFITGFRVGTWFASDISKLYARKTAQELQKEKIILDYFNFMGETELSTLIRGIDQFYSDSANYRVTFPYAIIIVIKKIAKDPESEVQSILEQIRKDVDTSQPGRSEITKAK